MLLTKMKNPEELLPQMKGKVFAITCHGCKEVNISEAEQEAEAFFEKAYQSSRMLGLMTADYICNPAYLKDRAEKFADKLHCDVNEVLPYVYVGITAVSNYMIFGEQDYIVPQMALIKNEINKLINNAEV